jgi:hypothetical protein
MQNPKNHSATGQPRYNSNLNQGGKKTWGPLKNDKTKPNYPQRPARQSNTKYFRRFFAKSVPYVVSNIFLAHKIYGPRFCSFGFGLEKIEENQAIFGFNLIVNNRQLKREARFGASLDFHGGRGVGASDDYLFSCSSVRLAPVSTSVTMNSWADMVVSRTRLIWKR